MKASKRYKINPHMGALFMMLCFLMVYPQDKGFTQEKVSKIQVVEVKVSPYVQAANILQDSIKALRHDRDEDQSATIALLRKKIAERPVKYIVLKPKPKPAVHDTVFYIMPNPTPDTDYFTNEVEPVIVRDTVIIIQKQPNLFQRIFKHKKPKQ